ncbi:MAG: hypothetical protein ABIR81_12705 [Ginsengibacter sp.]
MKSFLIAFTLLSIAGCLKAQDTLPAITVKSLNKTVLVSWTNTFETLTTINIQRSYDSLKNFRTIGSILDVKNKQNGFADDNPATLKMFYRVFIVFEGGAYIFSKSYRPVKDSVKPVAIKKLEDVVIDEPKKPLSKIDSAIINLPPLPVVKRTFVPSRYVYTGKDNNVVIALKDAATGKYKVKFYDESKTPIFEISKITEPYLTIDKVNFLHAGKFYFEIFEEQFLIEEHWLFIQKDGKFTNSQLEINRNFR